jgi:hypothetical protein
MLLPSTFPKSIPPAIYYGAMLWPYLIVGFGLYGLNSVWLAMGGYHLGMMIGLGLRRWPIRRPSLQWTLTVRLLVGVTFGGSLMAGVLVFGLWPWLVKLPDDALAPFLSGWGLTTRGWTPFGWYFCLVNPWLEELYWRGWLADASDRTWQTAGWFAGYHALVLLPLLHWEWVAVIVVILTVTGWWWSWLMKLGSGLSGPVLCHLAADASVIVALNKLYFLSSR